MKIYLMCQSPKASRLRKLHEFMDRSLSRTEKHIIFYNILNTAAPLIPALTDSFNVLIKGLDKL